ncbi:hypothetical protein [Chryseobacterium sp. HR92]|uniref:hypothetical protein n=1 Tax=Chryseobacterium sp. HR92 TaxID=3094839 RepID=UPI00388D568A|nr:hypothetical protein SFA27_13915 [Chryseobacterium sp. HR92]
MDKNINEKLDTVEKTGDTLLVLHHETGTVGIVKGLDDNGGVNRAIPQELNRDERLERGRQQVKEGTLGIVIYIRRRRRTGR